MQSAKAKINSLFISFVYYNFTLQYYNLVATSLLQKCYKIVTFTCLINFMNALDMAVPLLK